MIGFLLSTFLATQTSAVAVHNWWSVPQNFGDINELQSSIRVPANSDPITTYWMANGWVRGYMGMQHNTDTERRFLFSVWDNGHNSKVDTIQVGQDVVDENFGGEGTGAHGYLKVDWKTGETVHFRVTASVDAPNNATTYTGYYKRQGQNDWNLIVSYKAEQTITWLSSPYGFLENFGSDSSTLREGFWGNFSITNTNGQTYKPTSMSFSHTTPNSGDVWEQRMVNDEAYMRIDGTLSEGIYPPSSPN
ncbi:unnamed protein product [Cunninghamella blakesleeana]